MPGRSACTRATTSSALRCASGSAASASQISCRCRVRRIPRERSAANHSGVSCEWATTSRSCHDFLQLTCKDDKVIPMRRWTTALDRGEWSRLSGFAGAVLLLHVLGWGLFVRYVHSYPALAGLGTLAYSFGLRHAFDADHIAAIDNTTRKLLQDGKRS